MGQGYESCKIIAAGLIYYLDCGLVHYIDNGIVL
jgi:hypothetical protein